MVICIGEKCVWKRRKRIYNEVINLEDMIFIKFEIGKKKKKVVKFLIRNYDLCFKKVVNNENLVL